MTEMAESWGWIDGNGDDPRHRPCVSTKDRNLKKLLDIMLEESNPALQVGYIDLDEVFRTFNYYAQCNQTKIVEYKKILYIQLQNLS